MLEAVVLSDKLKGALSQAHHAISSRAQLPILLNFLIQAKDGKLLISATDLEIGIIVKIPAKVENEGETTVSAKTFLDLVSSIEQEKVTLAQRENLLELKAEKLKTTFPTISAEEFPRLFEDKGISRGEFDKKLLDKELSKIVFASATDIGRPALSGILIKGQQGKKTLTLVATDGYRLSLKEGLSASTKNDNTDSSYIIPARVIRELFSIKTGESIDFYTSEQNNQVVFDTPETTIVGRLIDATYPDYEKIIPDEFATTVEFDRGAALSAVRQCSVFAREAANIIKMSILKDKIIFSASASSVGENEVEIEAKTTGEENEIAFNSRYLIDFMGNIEEENIVFQMNGPLNSGVFRIKGVDSFLHLIMPIKINS